SPSPTCARAPSRDIPDPCHRGGLPAGRRRGRRDHSGRGRGGGSRSRGRRSHAPGARGGSTRPDNGDRCGRNRAGGRRRAAAFRFSGRSSARALVLGATALAAVFLAVGFVGVDRYGNNYWLYRGFPPPSDPAYVTQRGVEQRIAVTSPALGGRNQEVYVYLPP